MQHIATSTIADNAKQIFNLQACVLKMACCTIVPNWHNGLPLEGSNKGKTAPIRHPTGKVIRGSQMQGFRLSQVVGSGTLSESLMVRNESPS